MPDPKSSDKSLRFVPLVGSEDDQIAKENAALLALLHLMPSLPLERKVRIHVYIQKTGMIIQKMLYIICVQLHTTV